MEQAAAGGTGAAEERLAAVSAALEVLRAKWGGHYSFGHDAERGYWATRHGRVGHLLTADEPGELDRLVADDFRPVSR
jgi:hypothetical protein